MKVFPTAFLGTLPGPFAGRLSYRWQGDVLNTPYRLGTPAGLTLRIT